MAQICNIEIELTEESRALLDELRQFKQICGYCDEHQVTVQDLIDVGMYIEHSKSNPPKRKKRWKYPQDVPAETPVHMGEDGYLYPVDNKPPKRSKWHRVEDELPPVVKVILCKSPRHSCEFTGFYNGKWWMYPSEHEAEKVTHWRFLPNKPPKERNE